ncbi:hypothetical protein Z051_26275 [Rhodococcus rhodochrous KG-21]|uniref:Uncharacterized protein n=2 Tax=Rhodococcus rhodochrous TaxID=1829 RepID=A0A0M8PBQ6_RHORH|nr:hypothetical protein Z051_26275 [Rhodococcus rhodochrous KG-21]
MTQPGKHQPERVDQKMSCAVADTFADVVADLLVALLAHRLQAQHRLRRTWFTSTVGMQRFS